MHREQSTSQAGYIKKTWYNSLPRRPVTLFLLMAVTAVVFLFIDNYTENNLFTFFIPKSVKNFSRSSIEFNEEYLSSDRKENTTTLINPLSSVSAESLPTSISTTILRSVRNTVPSSVQTSVTTSVIKSTPNLSTSNSSTLVTNVECLLSPYVDCYLDTSKKELTNESFGIVLLRTPEWMNMETFDFKNCPYSNCKFQGDTIDNSTHLVIVNVVGLNDNFKTSKRFPDQLYAAAGWEPPYLTYASFLNDAKSYWNSAFNLTASYRTDSDIFVPYSRLLYQPISVERRPNYYEIAKNKTKSIAWFVSHCRTASRRHEYVKQMQKVIDVDIYGGCGQPCAPSIPLCHDDIPIKYRFYLSFENSLCTDYVTEKLFKIYTSNTHIIPVVRGALNYSKYIPNNTYINSANFGSAVDLAHFLKKLGDDPKAYSKYLEHKDHYKIINPPGFNLGCQACKFLNTKTRTSHVYNMKDWMGDNRCHEPTDL